MSNKRIVVPRDALPYIEAEQHAFLREYFCDKDAHAKAIPEGWEITLYWPDNGERYIDPRLSEGLDWLGQHSMSGMANYKQEENNYFKSLNDTWTLYAWSLWLAKTAPSISDNIVILHIDDHRDLGSPRLFSDPNGWRDPFTKKLVELNKPDTIASAIESGALGMGSFITPFLHQYPSTEIRHLCQPPKTTSPKNFKYITGQVADHFIDKNASRPCINLVETEKGPGPGIYSVTSDIADWLKGVDRRPVLLHIDMDYFNNRFDGDSDWSGNTQNLDPSITDVFVKIDELIEEMHHSNIALYIEDISIAYSPGFFPAEYWKPVSNYLFPRLRELLNRKDASLTPQ